MLIVNPWGITEFMRKKWIMELNKQFHEELDNMDYRSEEEKRIVWRYVDKAWDRADRSKLFPQLLL